MTLFAIPFPVLDPVAFEIGPLTVRWYGLAYMFGLLGGWLYARSLLANKGLWNGRPPAPPAIADDLLLWATFGVVLGGRLGYVLFYDPRFFLANPGEIIAVWNGGMSFHGGLAGVCLAVWLFSRARQIPMLSLADVACAVAPIGLFFGRLANFVNGELFGRVSDVPWAMIFPEGGPLPRHPSQLYEATLEGLLLFLALRYLTHGKKVLPFPGYVSGAFFAGYGIARSIAEFFRLPDPEHALTFGFLTPGIVYSLPMIAIGALILWRARSKGRAKA
ncbi:MAG: prolipoprotein diacylglyceryl transferase [Alphaproteobacteria bacterium]|nr:MAG: prolipoprotein diacylglyceryl transferase [Alphaproteobacteria bacterium]